MRINHADSVSRCRWCRKPMEPNTFGRCDECDEHYRMNRLKKTAADLRMGYD